MLSVQSVKEDVRRLLGLATKAEDAEIESLMIRGKEFDDEKVLPLDLLRQRLVATIPVDIRGRELNSEDLEHAAHAVFEDKERTLRNYRPI